MCSDFSSIFSAPPPPPPMMGNIPAKKLQTQMAEAPACVQNAMMTKDKKPFTYTPGGIDLSQIKSPRMAKSKQLAAVTRHSSSHNYFFLDRNFSQRQQSRSPTEGLSISSEQLKWKQQSAYCTNSNDPNDTRINSTSTSPTDGITSNGHAFPSFSNRSGYGQEQSAVVRSTVEW